MVRNNTALVQVGETLSQDLAAELHASVARGAVHLHTQACQCCDAPKPCAPASCHAPQGGVIYIADTGSVVSGGISISDSQLGNNTAQDSGGCIAVADESISGAVAIMNVAMTGNVAGGSGGCIAVLGGANVALISIQDSRIDRGMAGMSGGCMAVAGKSTAGDITFRNVSLTSNTATSSDGGCISVSEGSTIKSLSMNASDIVKCKAGRSGGGVSISGEGPALLIPVGDHGLPPRAQPCMLALHSGFLG